MTHSWCCSLLASHILILLSRCEFFPELIIAGVTRSQNYVHGLVHLWHYSCGIACSQYSLYGMGYSQGCSLLVSMVSILLTCCRSFLALIIASITHSQHYLYSNMCSWHYSISTIISAIPCMTWAIHSVALREYHSFPY